ncbi:MAG: hypothetical protein ABIB43_06265 [archaeon]
MDIDYELTFGEVDANDLEKTVNNYKAAINILPMYAVAAAATINQIPGFSSQAYEIMTGIGGLLLMCNFGDAWFTSKLMQKKMKYLDD